MRHFNFDFLLKIRAELEENLISPSEFVAKYLLTHPLQFQKNIMYPHLAHSPLSEIMDFLNTFQWKGYSDRIRRSLLKWHHKQYPLLLLFHIPTPLELLRLQAQGQRVVTVFLQQSEWRTEHHGKNPWDFTVHDLIHADHFFEDPLNWKGQVGFYQFLLRHWNDFPLRALHNQSGFEYLISDMNSHPYHLFLTLRALLLESMKAQASKNRYKGSEDQYPNRLNDKDEAQFHKIVLGWRAELLEKGVLLAEHLQV